MAFRRNMTLEEAHNVRRDRQIEALQEQLDRVVNLLEDGGLRLNRENVAVNEVNANSHDSSQESEDTSRSSGGTETSNHFRRRSRRPKDDLRDIKVDPPDFVGSSNPEDYFEWVQTLDRIIEVKGYDEKKGFKVAVMKLKKYASFWYDNMKNERELKGKSRVKTWSKLKEVMEKRFVPQAYMQEVYIQMNNLKQGTKDVIDYIREFEQLKIRTGVKEAEEHTIARLIGGLNSSIAEKMELQPLWSFESACKLAIQLEKQMKKRTPYKSFAKPVVPSQKANFKEVQLGKEK